MIKCIDVSAWNGELDYESLSEQGIEGVIIRCGWGNNGEGQDDYMFTRNIEECERLGLPYGVYLYSYATNLNEAESEAEHILELTRGLTPQLGYWLDIEDTNYYENSGLDIYGTDILTDIANKWLGIVENFGLCGIYCNLNYYRNILDLSPDTHLWLACWTDDEPVSPPEPCDIWQYSSSEVFDGVRLDTNLCYINIDNEEEREYINNVNTDTDNIEDFSSGDIVRVITDDNNNVYDVDGVLCHCYFEEYQITDINERGACLEVDGVIFARISIDKLRK